MAPALGRRGPICQDGRIGAAEAAAVLADLARQGTLVADIQLRPGADDTWLSEVRQFQVEGHGSHVLDLGGGFSQIWGGAEFRGTARTAIRKAERSGLDVEVDRSGQLLPGSGNWMRSPSSAGQPRSTSRCG